MEGHLKRTEKSPKNALQSLAIAFVFDNNKSDLSLVTLNAKTLFESVIWNQCIIYVMNYTPYTVLLENHECLDLHSAISSNETIRWVTLPWIFGIYP